MIRSVPKSTAYVYDVCVCHSDGNPCTGNVTMSITCVYNYKLQFTLFLLLITFSVITFLKHSVFSTLKDVIYFLICNLTWVGYIAEGHVHNLYIRVHVYLCIPHRHMYISLIAHCYVFASARVLYLNRKWVTAQVTLNNLHTKCCLFNFCFT